MGEHSSLEGALRMCCGVGYKIAGLELALLSPRDAIRSPIRIYRPRLQKKEKGKQRIAVNDAPLERWTTALPLMGAVAILRVELIYRALLFFFFSTSRGFVDYIHYEHLSSQYFNLQWNGFSSLR